MSTYGTPYEGRDSVIVPAVYVSGSLDLRLYTNAANSLTANTVLANLTYPTGTGYATYTLSGTWSSTNGVVTYDDGTPDNPQFTNSGATNWTTVTGAAITDGTYLLHFRDFTQSVTLEPDGIIEVDISSLLS